MCTHISRILQYINFAVHLVNKYNLIGRGGPGELELSFGQEWSVDQKVAAAQAFDELRNRRLIQSTLSDLVDPELGRNHRRRARSADRRHNPT